ncbi:HlyD family efflux transporter periplasmic adaptor subunit [Pseudomaricurvus alkylphenolicus]|jgi:cobalt-zinc-cadmium efflux system membrane fusion protein|uniref:efflux RND transporter periplasmic adaptor subunit n=1 Tax=Pseudomaricurvus alkylphenolicus TaxID=1306991 RepID=UPI00141FDDFC|nr:efflux RND transporter periplasmic adaptor subunit [Pseudomaricurvus alkylphenolicus]NIB39211.1 HlyD family efflux transporter periplasmic adaptor subunit [Pseudomaricurvus alkylphenolicus]
MNFLRTTHPLITAMMYIALASGLLPAKVLAGGGHSHPREAVEQEELKGPNGGKLLKKDDLTIEVTIFEQGIDPEMRLFAYLAGELIAPEQWQAAVRLNRLGGERDQLSFRAEKNYRVSQQIVREPHSYEVEVQAVVNNRKASWHYDNFEGRTQISRRQQQAAGIVVEPLGSGTLTFTDQLFGVIAAPENSVFHINAPYPGIVERIHVATGDHVKRGQKLLTIRNSRTLQTYSINSPADGEITARAVNQGDRTEKDGLLEITDLSRVWVEMSAFPESIEKLQLGQGVSVRDMHGHDLARGEVTYISPQMTGGHIARARALINNPDGHWRPGMHVRAEIELGQRQVPMAVKTTAIQSFRDMPVVFARYGDTFEVRMLELGAKAGDRVEVLGGILPGTEYVTENSFLLKADVLKDGASHDH